MVEILGIQLIGVIFGIGFIYLTFLNKKKNELNDIESLVWFLIGAGLVIVSIFPQILNYFVKEVLSVSRTLDFLVIVATLIMFGIIYYLFLIVKKTQNKMERLVREIAISAGNTPQNRQEKSKRK